MATNDPDTQHTATIQTNEPIESTGPPIDTIEASAWFNSSSQAPHMSPLSSTFTDEGNIPRRVEIGQWSPRSSEASLSPTGSLGVLSLADSSVVSGAASGVDTSCNSSPSPYEPGQYDDAPIPPDECTALSATSAHPSNSSTSFLNPSALEIGFSNGPSDAEEPNGTSIVLEGNPPATTLPPNDAHGPDSVTPPAALAVSRPKSPESGLDSSTTTIQQSSPSSPQRKSVDEIDPAHPPQLYSSGTGPNDNTPRALYSLIEHSPVHLEEQFEGLSFIPFTPTSTQPSLPLQSEISAERSDAPRAYPNIGNPSSDAVGTPTQTYPGISSPHPVNPIYSEPEWWDPDNLLSSQEAYMNTMANAMATPTTQRHRSLQLDGSYQDVAPHEPMNAREQGSTSGTGHTDDGSAETKRDGKGKGKATKFLEPPGLKWGASRRSRQRDKRREERNGWRSASDDESSGDESGDSSHPGSDSNSSVSMPPDIYVASPQGTLVPVPSTASPANPSGNGSSVFFPQVEPTPSPGPPLPLPIEDSTKEQVVLTDSDSESETIIDPSGVNLGLNFWGNFPMPFGYNDSNSNPYLTPNHGTSTGRLSSVHLGASPGGWATGTPLSLQGFPTPRPSGSTTRDGSHSLHRSPWLGPTAPDARYSQHSQGWPESFPTPTPGNRNQSAYHGTAQGYAPLPPSTGSTARNASLQATPLHPGGQTPSLLTPLGSTPWQGRPLRGLPGSHTSPMFFSPWGTGPANPHQMLPPNLTPNTTPGVGHASPFFSSFGGMQPGHQQQTPNWNATPNTAPPAYSGGNLHPNNNGTWTSSGAGGQGLLLPTAYRLHPRFAFADANVSFVLNDVEYRIHRYFLEMHSAYMRDLLATVPFYNNPIPLSVSNADFERLLSFFYPSSLNELEITTVEEWTSVFSLSTDWSFRDLRKRAIEEIAKLTTPVQRILLYRRHQVNEWAYSGYEELCMRGQPPSPDDGEQLGVRTVIKVWEAQQELMKKGFCRMNCCKEFTESTIKGKFNLL